MEMRIVLAIKQHE